jgi:hypothetical protein
MANPIEAPRVLFIDGLPGSGKSTAAQDIGHRYPRSRIYLESAADHPLLVGVPDAVGAAFADIHRLHSAQSFAAAALEKLGAFLQTAEHDVLYVFESHPVQSTVRVLLQMDAPWATIATFWSQLQDSLAPLEPWLLYLRESDPRQAIANTFRARGADWERYVVEAFQQTPWMISRGLSGREGMLFMFVEYGQCMDRLLRLWRFPILTLPAQPASYEARTKVMLDWLRKSGLGD